MKGQKPEIVPACGIRYWLSIVLYIINSLMEQEKEAVFMEKKGTGITYVKVVVNLIIMALLILCCFLVLPKIIVYFMPFVIGWIISLIANPIVRFFEMKLKVRRKMGSVVVIIAVLALVIGGGYFLLSWLLEQLISFINELPEMWESAQVDFDNIGKRLMLMYQYLPKNWQQNLDGFLVKFQTLWGDWAGTLSTPTIAAVGNFAKNLPLIVIGIIMSLLSSYFFVAEPDYIHHIWEKILPLALQDRIAMIKRGLKRAVGGYFKAQLKIEVWMYVLLGIGFWILHVRYAFIIAIGVAILDLLPFFGTGTVLVPWAIIKFFNGEYGMVIGLMIIWGVGQLFRQLIQPKIVGDSVGLAPLPTLFLLYIGYRMGGVWGMLLAVPIGIIIFNMYEEGVFDTTIKSIQILYSGASNFRHITDEDMEPVRRYKLLEQERMKQSRERKEAGKESKGTEAGK